MRTQRTARTGFTIVEMMVATALILFIMAIISTVFASASQTFRALKAAGDMQERLRTVTGVLRRDLATEHFEGQNRLGGPRLGDQRMDQAGWRPPFKGYFEIRQSPIPQFLPANIPTFFEPGSTAFPTMPDGEQLYSTRATTHVLRFTNKAAGGAPNDLYCCEWVPTPGVAPTTLDPLNNPRVNAFPPSLPPALSAQGVIYSRWVEIQYFLLPNGDATLTNAAGVSLTRYSLRRRVRLLAPAGADFLVPSSQAAAVLQYNPGIALIIVGQLPGNPAVTVMRVLGPEDVTNPLYRMQYQTPTMKLGVDSGDDILMTDVLSFEVKAAWFRNLSFNNFDVANPSVTGLYGSSPDSRPMFNPLLNPNITVNGDAPFDDLPQAVLNTLPNYAGQRVFDTYFNDPSSDNIDWEKASTTNNGFLIPRNYQVPLRINVRSLQIKIRVWDAKSEQTRQVTLIQEMQVAEFVEIQQRLLVVSQIVVFRSAKVRPFAERKATMATKFVEIGRFGE